MLNWKNLKNTIFLQKRINKFFSQEISLLENIPEFSIEWVFSIETSWDQSRWDGPMSARVERELPDRR